MLPRNENDRLDAPPETRVPGEAASMRGMDSMKSLACPLCFSMPVATARTLAGLGDDRALFALLVPEDGHGQRPPPRNSHVAVG
jgi:hypothetical protein